MNTCTDCGTTFAYDESPVDDRCVVCLDRRAAWFGEPDLAELTLRGWVR